MAVDKRIQIRQLRAKARSTTFPHEAAALNAKADELESRHGPAAPEQRARATFRPGPTQDEMRHRAEAEQRVSERAAQGWREQMRRFEETVSRMHFGDGVVNMTTTGNMTSGDMLDGITITIRYQ